MIPASYLFKDYYRRKWEEPDDAPTAAERHSFLHGLMTPIAGALNAVLARRIGTDHLRRSAQTSAPPSN